jgi:hypothetical protein
MSSSTTRTSLRSASPCAADADTWPSLLADAEGNMITRHGCIVWVVTEAARSYLAGRSTFKLEDDGSPP